MSIEIALFIQTLPNTLKYFIYIAWFLTGIGATIAGHKTLESYILPTYSTSTVNKNEPSFSELLNRRSALEYKFPIIKQDRFSFCGIASVANVLHSFGISVPNQDGLLKKSYLAPGLLECLLQRCDTRRDGETN